MIEGLIGPWHHSSHEEDQGTRDPAEGAEKRSAQSVTFRPYLPDPGSYWRWAERKPEFFPLE